MLYLKKMQFANLIYSLVFLSSSTIVWLASSPNDPNPASNFPRVGEGEISPFIPLYWVVPENIHTYSVIARGGAGGRSQAPPKFGQQLVQNIQKKNSNSVNILLLLVSQISTSQQSNVGRVGSSRQSFRLTKS